MRMNKYLSGMVQSEIDKLREKLNLTDEETEVFNLLAKGKSKVYIADHCLCSTSTVDNRIKGIKKKIEKVVI